METTSSCSNQWTSPSSCPANSGISGAGAVLFTSLISSLIESQHQLGNPNDYPPDATSYLLDEYDFVIIGAGSSGSVIAGRLSEVRDWKILLLEAGGDPPPTSDIPFLAPTLEGTEVDWKFKTTPQEGSCEGFIGKQCKWPRGKVLGGTSILNYMVYIRGMKEDFNEWERAGNKGWSFDDILPLFKKSEDMQQEELLGEHANGISYHSKGGPLTINRFDESNDLVDTLLSAAKELGYKDLKDMNTDDQHGFSRFSFTVRNGTRCNTAKAFLSPAKNRKNLHVTKHAFVTKILIDPLSKSATAVQFVTKDGKYHEVKIKNEVILSAGAVSSPQILMLSGVGPEEHLQDVGVKPVIANLKVGENLQDHFHVISSVYNTKITPHAKPSPNFLLDASYEYLTKRTGYLATHPFTTLVGFIKTESSPKHERPNIENHFFALRHGDFKAVESLSNGAGFYNETTNSIKELVKESDVLFFIPTLARPKSRGKILLHSSDPFAHPKIYPGYLTDPEGVDITAMVEAIHFTQRLMKTKTMIDKKSKQAKLYIEKCESIEFNSRAYWECTLRQIGSTLFHPAGSCKMGPRTDPNAVVDPELKVHGVKGIRVADASIMPTIVSVNLNAACIMIGEKVSDMIKRDWLTN